MTYKWEQGKGYKESPDKVGIAPDSIGTWCVKTDISQSKHGIFLLSGIHVRTTERLAKGYVHRQRTGLGEKVNFTLIE